MRWFSVVATVTAAVALCQAASNDEINELVSSIIRGVSSDAEKAEKLVDAARDIKDTPEAQRIFLERAVEYGLKGPKGYRFAARAVDRLEKLFPDRSDEWQEKRLVIARRLYISARGPTRTQAGQYLVDKLIETGDAKVGALKSAAAIALYQEALPISTYLKDYRKKAIIGRLKNTRKKALAEKRITELMSKLDKDPKDVKARTDLIRYYLLEMDKPKMAAKLLNDDVELELGVIIPLASKPLGKLMSDEAKELGFWYKKQADDLPDAGKRIALGRTVAYLEKYMSDEKVKGVDKLKAKLIVKQASDQLKKLGGPAAASTITAQIPAGAAAIFTFDKSTVSGSGERVLARDMSGKGVLARLIRYESAKGIAGEGVAVSRGRQYVDLNIPNAPTPKTICFWAKASKPSSAVMIFGHWDSEPKGNRFYIGTFKSEMGLGLGDSMFKGECKTSLDDQWHHYALVYNGAIMAAYIDGKLRGTKKGTYKTSGRFYLGTTQMSKEASDKRGLNGVVDEFVMYTRPLTEAEINRIYQLGKSGKSLK